MNLNRWQAQYTFWSSFGLPAYEQNSVPDARDITYPYITYEVVGAPPISNTFINVSIWTRSSSPRIAMSIADKIFERFKSGEAEIKYNGGGFFMTPEDNFIQIMDDNSDKSIKRAILSLVIHW